VVVFIKSSVCFEDNPFDEIAGLSPPAALRTRTMPVA
jgi:hypothetical protein